MHMRACARAHTHTHLFLSRAFQIHADRSQQFYSKCKNGFDERIFEDKNIAEELILDSGSDEHILEDETFPHESDSERGEEREREREREITHSGPAVHSLTHVCL
jgi:hypothetical protein